MAIYGYQSQVRDKGESKLRLKELTLIFPPLQLAQVAYDELLNEFRGKILPSNHAVTRHVQRVVSRILESSDLGQLRSSEPRRPLEALDDFWSEDPFTSGRPSGESSTPESGGKEWNLLVVNDPSVVNAMATFGSHSSCLCK